MRLLFSTRFLCLIVLLLSLAACTVNGSEEEEMEGSVATPPELLPAPDSMVAPKQPTATDTVQHVLDTTAVVK